MNYQTKVCTPITAWRARMEPVLAEIGRALKPLPKVKPNTAEPQPKPVEVLIINSNGDYETKVS